LVAEKEGKEEKGKRERRAHYRAAEKTLMKREKGGEGQALSSK